MGYIINPYNYAATGETKFVMEVEVTAGDLDFTITTGWNSGWDGMDFNVDWGDSTSDSNVVHDITHTYPSANTYTIKIDGRFAMNNHDSGATNREKIKKLKKNEKQFTFSE